MKKLLTGLLRGASIFSLAGCGNKTISYDGYLIDQHCAEMKKGEEETLKCLKMEKCESSGYGIAIDAGNEEEKFIKFNEEGHEKAKEFIVNDINKYFFNYMEEINSYFYNKLKEETFSKENTIFWDEVKSRWGKGCGYRNDIIDFYENNLEDNY